METTVEMIPEQEQEAVQAQEELIDPYQLIVEKGGPTKDAVLAMKLQTPNGKLKIFTPDGGKRVFIIRAIGHMELATLSKMLPKNLEPEQKAIELELMVTAKCVVWTNSTSSTKLSPDELKAGAAGLSSTIFAFVTWMSDYVEPTSFVMLSADL